MRKSEPYAPYQCVALLEVRVRRSGEKYFIVERNSCQPIDFLPCPYVNAVSGAGILGLVVAQGNEVVYDEADTLGRDKISIITELVNYLSEELKKRL